MASESSTQPPPRQTSALESIVPTGIFAAAGEIADDDCEEPKITVQDVGPIKLPLGEDQARQIIAKARQAPFGKGSQTIVDTSVRKNWELDPSQFAFENPRERQDFVQRLCVTVQQKLGIKSPIHAELYKMLIYETGAMFKPHTDSEKIPGMFGTLVICLPSAHQGGEVVVRHANQQKTFSTSQSRQSYACWYSDVSHEVLPVTSGYRWVLTYNLTLSLDASDPTVDVATAESRHLQRVLRRWLGQAQQLAGAAEQVPERLDQDACADHFFFALEHEYTEASLSLEAMKSADRARVLALSAVSTILPFDIFLVALEKEVIMDVTNQFEDNAHGYYWDGEDSDEEDENENDDEDEDDGVRYRTIIPEEGEFVEATFTVKKLVDLKGRIVLSNVEIDGISTLQKDIFGEDPYDEEESGYTGNEGATETSWYRNAAVIIRRDQTALFLKGAMSPCGLLSKLVSAHQREDWIIPDFFESKTVKELIGGSSEGLAKFGTGLARAVFLLPRLRDQLGALLAIAPTETSRTYVRNWAMDVFDQALHRAKSATLFARDGELIMQLTRIRYGCLGDAASLYTDVLPLVVDKLAQTGFCLTFLNDLYRFMETGWPDPKDMQLQWNRLARKVILAMDVSSISGPLPAVPVSEGPKPAHFYLWKTTEHSMSINPAVLTEFAGRLLLPGMDNQAIQHLFQKLASEAFQFTDAAFHAFWIPFLQNLIPVLESHSRPLSDPTYQTVYTAILCAYANNFVKEQPPKESNLDRTPVYCHANGPLSRDMNPCHDCRHLNSFLRGPTQSVTRCQINGKRRRHIQSMLYGTNGCSSKIEKAPRCNILVLTKTWPENEAARKSWAKRKAKAAEQLKVFNQSNLMLLLGDSDGTIGRMTVTAPGGANPAVAPLQALAPMSPNQPGQAGRAVAIQGPAAPKHVAGVKRKASESEMIDLTGDD